MNPFRRPHSRVHCTAYLAAALACVPSLAAQQTPAEAESARVHVVRPGDTLWDLARQYLNDPFLWPEIFRFNTAVVQDPARIFPAERIRIPNAAGAEAPRADTELVFGRAEETVRDATGLTIRPAGTANVPIVTPGDYYSAGFIAPKTDVVPLGILAERLSAGIVPIRRSAQISLYDRVYVTVATPTAIRLGDRLHFFRPGRTVKPFGQLYHATGIGTIAAVDGAVATVVVTDVFAPLAVGDLALPTTRFPVVAGVSPRPRAGVEGQVVAFETQAILQSTQNVAYLNVGRAAGIAEGDEFEAYLPRERKGWGVRPEVPVARLQVVRIGDRTAAVRITELEHPALRVGLPVRLVAKMP